MAIYVERPSLPDDLLNKRAFWRYAGKGLYVHESTIEDSPPKLQKIQITKKLKDEGEIESYVFVVTSRDQAVKALVFAKGIKTDIAVPNEGQYVLTITVENTDKFDLIHLILRRLSTVETLPKPLKEHIYLFCDLPQNREKIAINELISGFAQGKKSIKDFKLEEVRFPETCLALAKTCDHVPDLRPLKGRILRAGLDLIELDLTVKLNTDPNVTAALYELSAKHLFQEQSSEKSLTSGFASGATYSVFRLALTGAFAGWEPARQFATRLLWGARFDSDIAPAPFKFSPQDIDASAADLWRLANTDQRPVPVNDLINSNVGSVFSNAQFSNRENGESKRSAEEKELKESEERVQAQGSYRNPDFMGYTYLPIQDQEVYQDFSTPVSMWQKKESPIPQLLLGDALKDCLVCYEFVSTEHRETALTVGQILIEDRVNDTDKKPVYNFVLSTHDNAAGTRFREALLAASTQKSLDCKNRVSTEVEIHAKKPAMYYFRALIPKDGKKIVTFLEILALIQMHIILPVDLKIELCKALGFGYELALSDEVDIHFSEMISGTEVNLACWQRVMQFAEKHKSTQLYWELANVCRKTEGLQDHELPALLACIKLVETHPAIRNQLEPDSSIGDLYADAAACELALYQRQNSPSLNEGRVPNLLFSAFVHALKGAQTGWERAKALANDIFNNHVAKQRDTLLSSTPAVALNFNFSKISTYAETLWRIAKGPAADSEIQRYIQQQSMLAQKPATVESNGALPGTPSAVLESASDNASSSSMTSSTPSVSSTSEQGSSSLAQRQNASATDNSSSAHPEAPIFVLTPQAINAASAAAPTTTVPASTDANNPATEPSSTTSASANPVPVSKANAKKAAGKKKAKAKVK